MIVSLIKVAIIDNYNWMDEVKMANYGMLLIKNIVMNIEDFEIQRTF